MTLLAQVPVLPGREQARAWAVEELAKREYAARRPGLVERALQWLQQRLGDLQLPAGPGSALLVGVVTVVVLAVLAYVLHRSGGLGRAARVKSADLFDTQRPRTAAEHRSAADAAAAGGDWRTAVLERFRAVVRELEERTVLSPEPGRTADEAAAAAATALPSLAGALTAGAHLFDDVRYGDRPASSDADARLRALDAEVRAARPVLT